MDRCDNDGCNSLLMRDSGRCPQCNPELEERRCVYPVENGVCGHDSADYGRVIDGDYYCFVHVDRVQEQQGDRDR